MPHHSLIRNTKVRIGLPSSFATSNPLQLLITQLNSLLSLIPEPISLADIKSSFLCYHQDGIKVRSTFELLLKPLIVFELGKQCGKLLF